MAALRRATKLTPQKSALTSVYLAMVAAGRLQPQPQLRALLVKKSSKSQSGVLVRLFPPPAHAAATLLMTCGRTAAAVGC